MATACASSTVSRSPLPISLLTRSPMSIQPIGQSFEDRSRQADPLCLSQTYWLAVDRESGDADL
jgi:hypothetical protein